MKKVPCFKKAY